jgi:DNA polymerase II large subunit
MAYTVKELIEELQCFEGDKIVWVQMDNMLAPVRFVDLGKEEDGNEDKLIIK